MAKLEARLLTIAALCMGSNPDISQKIQNGRHKQRSGRLTLAAKKIEGSRENAGLLGPLSWSAQRYLAGEGEFGYVTVAVS